MMKYEEFKQLVLRHFQDYLPEEFADIMHVRPVTKINRTLDGIVIGTGSISPTIYINDMYDHYMQCNDSAVVFASAAETMVQAMKGVSEIAFDIEDAKEQIVYQLVNTCQNTELLKKLPHREFQDLSIIYRWVTKQDAEGIQSVLIQHDLAERLGLNEGQLYELSMENTRRMFPPVVRTIQDMLRDIMDLPTDVPDLVMDEIFPDMQMWVITNSSGINGAAYVADEDVLQNLAEQIGTDFYILPSSIHEVIAVPSALGSPEELAQMVRDVNINEVRAEERLSNQVYHYDKEKHEIFLVTDTPHKRLDDISVRETEHTQKKKQMRRPKM